MSDNELRARNRVVVEEFFASDLTKPEERLALWHDDGVKELPFAPAGLPHATEAAARAKGRSPLGATK
jgi:hypothetical protein